MLAGEGFQISETGESNYDDPSLALLFSRLKSMSLQTIKGTSMIPGQQEFDFVLQIARVFCRMGERELNITKIVLIIHRLPSTGAGPCHLLVFRPARDSSWMGLGPEESGKLYVTARISCKLFTTLTALCISTPVHRHR